MAEPKRRYLVPGYIKANFIKVMSVSFDILPFEVSQEQLTFASHPNIGRRFFHATVGILRF